jgi:putative heme-binding domain-containing protein
VPPQGVQQGAALFQLHCAVCHGARGEGGRGADLTAGRYRRGGSDADLFSTIRNGVPGSDMPAIRATDEEVWKMAAFVKRLGNAGASQIAKGNPSAGKALFEGKGRCLSCHSIGPAGGSLGPDLEGVGRRRNLVYLEESLLRPEADVAIRYRAVRLIPRSGPPITGVRLNEDDVSIQVRDTADNLRSILKTDLKEIRRDQPSPMPSYASALTRTELDDVIAYLSSLRGGQ